ncbi:uroporphyrinogen-III C-methyltransferase [Rhodobacteraceae bacterium CCMM004]|nr:uroporphyrinogen-III C-methyltransferase [Rhodobacteraceae bacterium CCMM004]
MKPFGTVSLVGAGPGDPELLTLRAARRILDADVVVHDRLVPTAIVDLARPGARRIPVGKRAGFHPVPQDDINALLVDLAMTGAHVVRLKGGDPFIFGRGSEEAAVLRRAGIAVEVVPGITAAQGAAASLGMPLTERDCATGVRYVTGHRKGDAPLELDWDGLADPDTTLVVYMGAANMAEIAARLIAAGLSRDMPVLAVSKVTTPDEARATSSLGRVGADPVIRALPSPVLFVVGRVVALAEAGQAVLPEVALHAPHLAEGAHA